MSSSIPGIDGHKVHTASAVGFNGANNTLYDSHRPTYADVSVDWILNHTVWPQVEALLQQPAPSTVPPEPRTFRLVDVGAGTGIFTRCLAKRVAVFEAAHVKELAARSIRIEVSALDPVEGMRQRFEENSPGLKIEAGSGSSMPTLADHSIDVLFAAQAFHWFATKESLVEFARVLKPAGFFAPIFNRAQKDSLTLQVLWDLVEKYFNTGVPQSRTGEWKQVFEPANESLFKLAAFEDQKNTLKQHGDANLALGRIFSISVIASLSKDEQAELRQKMLGVIATHELTKNLKEFTIAYDTEVYAYQLKA